MNKDNNKELEQMIKNDRNLTIPAGGKQVVMDAIQKAKMDKRRKHRKMFVGSFTAAAAVFGLLLLPNINQSIANAMGELPVVGGFFKVVTIRDYNEDDGIQSLDVKVPGIDFESSEQEASQLDVTAEKVSGKIDTYIEQLVAQFTADSAAAGYRNLYVSYDVVTDTENWFTTNMMNKVHTNTLIPMVEDDCLSNLFYIVIGTHKEKNETMYDVISSRYERTSFSAEKVKTLLDMKFISAGAKEENGEIIVAALDTPQQPEQKIRINGEEV